MSLFILNHVRIEDPIDVDALRNEASETKVFYHDLHSSGDGVESPIDVNAVPAATNDATEIIESLSPSPTQTKHMSDGRSLGACYECKICYRNVVDLALGCGHTYCYDCFNRFFHDSVLAKARESQASAYEHLASRLCVPSCPYCNKVLPGQYTEPEDRDHLNGFYVALRCPYSEVDCFLNGYMAQGIKLKIL